MKLLFPVLIGAVMWCAPASATTYLWEVTAPGGVSSFSVTDYVSVEFSEYTDDDAHTRIASDSEPLTIAEGFGLKTGSTTAWGYITPFDESSLFYSIYYPDGQLEYERQLYLFGTHGEFIDVLDLNGNDLSDFNLFNFGVVPEPMIWIEMIAGLFLIGSSIRNARHQNRTLRECRESES